VARALALLALTVASPLQAQLAAPRSAAYLFTANVEDARALWINPAGLGVLPVASIYAEVAGDRPITGDGWDLRQYSFGLQSRALALGYQRDRPAAGNGQGYWRLGAGFPLGRRLALGTGVTFTRPERGLDIGLRVSPLRPLDVGLVVRDIGRPVVRATKQPLSVTGGVAVHLAGGRIGLQADGVGTERMVTAGWDVGYRAGALFLVPARAPISIVTAFDLADNFRVNRWSLGLGIGFAAQVLAVGSAVPETGSSVQLQSFNVTGVARGLIRR
jgi:hypothetical protein